MFKTILVTILASMVIQNDPNNICCTTQQGRLPWPLEIEIKRIFARIFSSNLHEKIFDINNHNISKV